MHDATPAPDDPAWIGDMALRGTYATINAYRHPDGAVELFQFDGDELVRRWPLKTPVRSVSPPEVDVEIRPCVVGCLGDCETLGDARDGEEQLRAQWHARIVDVLSSPFLSSLTWLIGDMAMATDGEGGSVHPDQLSEFVATHNWPDPTMAAEFAMAWEGMVAGVAAGRR